MATDDRNTAQVKAKVMPLQLVLDEYDRIDLPLADSVLEAWRLQFDRAAVAYNTVPLAERIANCVADGLTKCLDWDLQPPTEKQLRYAQVIARELKVSLSGDALRYRGTMTAFLDRFAETYKARRIRRSFPGEALNTPEEE